MSYQTTGFTQIPNKLYFNEELTRIERTVIEVITLHSFKKSHCYMSYTRLSKLAKYCRSYVINAVKSLIEKGFIKKFDRKVDKQQYTNMYVLTEKSKVDKKEVEEVKEEIKEKIENAEDIKADLVKEFGLDAVEMSLKELKKQNKIVCDLKAYLSAICKKVKVQLDILKNVNTTTNKTSAAKTENKETDKKINTKSKFHNFDSRYTGIDNSEMEEVLLKRQKRMMERQNKL